MSVFLIFIFVVIRITIIALAVLLGYKFGKSIIEPQILRPECLTDTNNCASLAIHKYKNSFIAQVFPSGIFIWFNGTRLYVYGSAPGVCELKDQFEPADVIDITGTNDNAIYSRQNYQCISKAATIINYYETVLNVKPITIYIRGSSPTKAANLNVFDIFQRLVDEGIISINNIKKIPS